MDKRNRSGNRSNSIVDPDNKLEQYKLINNQLTQGVASLKERIKLLNNEILDSRKENLRLKSKYLTLKRMFVEHIQAMTVQIQSNAEKIHKLCDETEMVDRAKDQSSTSSTKASSSTDVDTSRRLSKCFEPPRANNNLFEEVFDEALVTIDEQSDEETITEGDERSRESEGSSSEDDSSEDQSIPQDDEKRKVNTDEESKTKIDEGSGVNSDDESKVNSDEDSKVNSNEGSGVSSDEDSGERGVLINEESQIQSDQESQLENDDQSQVKNDESGGDSTEDSPDGDDQRRKRIKNIDSSQEGSDSEDETDHTEKISLVTTLNGSTIRTINSNKENEWPSTVAISPSIISINEESRSILNVNGQSMHKSTVGSTTAKLPLKENFIHNRVAHLQLESSANNFAETMKKQEIVSSTPYKKEESSNDSTTDIEKSSTAKFSSGTHTHVNRSRQDISKTVISPRPQSKAVPTRQSRSSTAESMDSTMLTRPKRRASPINYSEPKLNTKLRRPR